jgi:periplasmic divalent cation tolerance protein
VFFAPLYGYAGRMALLVVFCTFPDKEAAQRIALALVEERLVACVNVLPGVRSVYRWEGRVETAEEVLAVMKTTEEAYAGLEARIKELHPYEVPEIVAVPVGKVEARYAGWVGEMTKSEIRMTNDEI